MKLPSWWIISLCIFEVIIGSLSAEGGSYVGCYKDEGHPRSFRGFAENFNNLTPDKCTELCLSKGFLFSATQGRTFCFCDDKHPNPNSRVSQDRCSRPCAGDASQKCAGDDSLSVWRTGIPDNSEVGNYIGCFDDHSRLLNDKALTLDTTNSPRRCMNYCLHLGYKYSGVQYGRGCHCGNLDPERQHGREGDECNWPCPGDAGQSCGGNWRMAIYGTSASGSQTSTEVGNYLGCFKALENPLKSGHVENVNDLTNQKCTSLCFSKGYLYSWTQNSKTCFCGDKHPNPNSKVSEEKCSKSCAGNAGEKCGGEKELSVRETGIPDFAEASNYIGCYDDHTRLLKDYATNLELTNSPRRCMNLCLKLGYKFSGVQYGKGCHCGNYKPDGQYAQHGDECNWPCPGDAGQSCGGNWRMAIYGISTTEVVDRESCSKSETLVNGEVACAGEVVFDESFSDTISNKWKHVVMIPDTPDYEFNVFLSDKKNSFTRDGKLVIKPTVYDDSHTLTGTLNLQGCTAKTNDPSQCGYTAFSNRILPPVASARINTRDSFSFRYGKIEITAKMPKGDWLVPELWLEPKDDIYGDGYASGRVRIAMSRGNTDLKCGGDDYGQRQLESGVVMGLKNDVRKRSVRVKVPENWHSRYHNYTIIWTPGSISFKVDNERPRDIIPGGNKRLCTIHEFNEDECLTWSSGSRLAPLDKHFYISLGLSSGNALDFPDGCVNRGNEKPWKNLEYKALLKFWQAKEQWSPTWQEGESALYVDHVRVTAL